MILDFYIIAGIYLLTVLLSFIGNLVRAKQGKHVTKAEKTWGILVPVINLFVFADIFKKNK